MGTSHPPEVAGSYCGDAETCSNFLQFNERRCEETRAHTDGFSQTVYRKVSLLLPHYSALLPPLNTIFLRLTNKLYI